jgi:hypothetical protein
MALLARVGAWLVAACLPWPNGLLKLPYSLVPGALRSAHTPSIALSLLLGRSDCLCRPWEMIKIK